MTLKYKVGDKVQVCVDHYGDDIPKGAILNVVADAQLGAHWITTTEAEVSMCNAYPEEFKLVDVPKEQSPQTSNETGDYAAVCTAISFAKVKDKQPHSLDIYDENSTQIEVLNEGNGMFLSITQSGVGITLDFGEVEPLFQAIKKLINQPLLKGESV